MPGFNTILGLQDYRAPADAHMGAVRKQEAFEIEKQDRNMKLVGRAASHLLTVDPAERAASFEQIAQTLKGGYDLDISQYRDQATGPQSNAFLESAVAATTKRAAPSAERYETVQDPYGRGGAGQRETTTGRIVGYQGPPKDKTDLGTTAMQNAAAMGLKPGTPEHSEYIRGVTERGGAAAKASTLTFHKGEKEKTVLARNVKGAQALVDAGWVSGPVKGTAATQKRKYQSIPYRYKGEIYDGRFNTFTGRHEMRVDGEWGAVPEGAHATTRGSEQRVEALTAKNFHALEKNVNAEERSVRQLQRYFKDVTDIDVGMSRIVTGWTTAFKTFMGDTGLTENELKQAVSSGRLQGLLGAFRKEIVGGGVMTEQDALRVITALGGNVSSLQNPTVVERLLRDIMKEKVHSYNILATQYNDQIQLGSRGKSRKAKKLLDPESSLTPGAVPEAKSIPTFTVDTVDEGYAKLKSGDVYIGPDGKQRTKR